MHNKIKEHTTLTQLIDVRTAANYLGVHEATIRRWAYAKRLKGIKIGIRGDWRFNPTDLKDIAMPESSSVSVLKPANKVISFSNYDSIKDNTHYVKFYENEDYLVKEIKYFIDSGDTAIVVASPDHTKKLEKGFNIYGLDLSDARSKGLYINLDARTTLNKFMVGDLPNPDLFFNVIGGLIARAARNKKRLRVFGEMVALLWADGNQDGAIKLEALWNELQKIHNFSLFCAYPMDNFKNKSDMIPFEKIEETHSHVIPSESYSALIDDNARLREISKLQQKAQALESEIKKHKETELTLLKTLVALKNSEEFSRRIIENSADCIKILDLRGKLISMNRPGCNIMEIDNLKEYLGKNYRDFWKDGYTLQVNNAIKQAKKGEIGRFQGFLPTAKGTPKWWDVVITPILNSENTVEKLLVISRDITSIKELEQRKEDFINATSHELKTPLTSQKAFIQLLERRLSQHNNPDYLRYIRKINDQSDRLTKLINDLLDASKISGGKLTLNLDHFDLNKCVKNTVEEIQAMSAKHMILVKGHIEDKILGDQEKISQVINNLLTNAIKYSPDANSIYITLKQLGENVTISVKDFGIGIEKKELKKLFDRFYRVNDNNTNTFPGLGMGLYISSEIIKQHQGKFHVKSEKGKGSIFSFTIPLN